MQILQCTSRFKSNLNRLQMSLKIKKYPRATFLVFLNVTLIRVDMALKIPRVDLKPRLNSMRIFFQVHCACQKKV